MQAQSIPDTIKSRWTLFRSLILPAIFFCTVFWYFWRIIDPRAIYELNGLAHYTYVFELSWSFFLKTISLPDGLIQYTMAALTQACHAAWLGALLLALIAFAFYALAARVITAFGGIAFFPVLYIPALIMLCFYGIYEHNWLAPMLRVLGALVCSYFFMRLPITSRWMYLIAAILLFGVTYWAFGLGCLVFAMIAILTELKHDKGTAFILLGILAIAIFIPDIIGYLFYNSYAFLDFRKIAKTENPIALMYLYFPLLLVILKAEAAVHPRLIRIFGLDRAGRPIPHSENRRASLKKQSPARRETAPDSSSSEAGRNPINWTLLCGRGVALAALIGALWLAHGFYSPSRKDMALRIHFIRANQWEKVLALHNPRFLQSMSDFNIFSINFSLVQTGRLGSQMFAYPPLTSPEGLMLLKSFEKNFLPVWAVCAEFFMKLGSPVFAEKMAGELMAQSAPLGPLLRTRALYNCAKGLTSTALIYLNCLVNVPYFRSEARAVMANLGDTALLFNNPDIKTMHAYQDTVDYLIYKSDEEKILLSLLQSNQRNKMAFEYLMAYYMLTRRLDAFVRNFPRIDDFDYPAIPTHWEEALLIYSKIMKQPVEQLTNRTISERTLQRFAAFQQYDLSDRHAGNPSGPLFATFGDSYFFFFMFGYSGALP
jgi:hypothetical protein